MENLEQRRLERYRRDIEQMVRRRADFTDVEDMIDALTVSDDHKTVLWLYAWSYTPPGQRFDLLLDPA